MKKMNFFEALAIAQENRLVRFKGGVWSHYMNKGRAANLLDSSFCPWWPTIEEQQENEWEVEPEEIVVWCVCNDNGGSLIFNDHPIKSTRSWQDPNGAHFLKDNDLFSKNKPKKYKLVLIPDNEETTAPQVQETTEEKGED